MTFRFASCCCGLSNVFFWHVCSVWIYLGVTFRLPCGSTVRPHMECIRVWGITGPWVRPIGW